MIERLKTDRCIPGAQVFSPGAVHVLNATPGQGSPIKEPHFSSGIHPYPINIDDIVAKLKLKKNLQIPGSRVMSLSTPIQFILTPWLQS